MEERKYEIGGKTFIQRPLVLGQWRQLKELMRSVVLPVNLDPGALITAFGSHFFTALAIVLIEEGKTAKDKDLNALAAEIEFGILPETALQVMSDFFDLNPIPSILRNLTEMTDQLTRKILEKMKEIGSMSSASSSPEGTSPEKTGYSGTSH